MRVAMIGAGYVGLVSAACMSEFGIDVVCVDSDRDRIAELETGAVPLYEPGLEDLVAGNIGARRLSFSADAEAAVAAADAVFIAVGTPSRRGDGHADLSYVHAAAEEVARFLDGYTVVVTKSTVPVGTSRRIAEIIAKVRPDAEFDVASNPEFLREGSAIEDFMRPDRIVIGAETDRARELLHRLYRPLYLLETPILFTTLESAELIKYAANGFLATKITFINEIADLCEKLGADVQTVARGIGIDRRIGEKFLHAGPGFGGSCFPKDALALAKTARDSGAPVRIIETVVDVNDRRRSGMAQRIIGICGGSVAGRTIAVLGLTFKPNTDDIRESPGIAIAAALGDAGAAVRAYDPEGMAEAGKRLAHAEFCSDAYAAMTGADALVIVTEWNEFRLLDLARAKALMARPLVIDLRNIYDPDEMRAAAFDYHSIGRAPVLAGGGS